MSFICKNYERQSKHFEIFLEERKDIAASWFDSGSADYWRHQRCYEFFECFSSKQSSWLTIGDGRWGLDSIRIRAFGFQNVLPTDLTSSLLEQAKSQGFIEDYRVENAEKLSFFDDEFDFVFCKEAFHHFPRPYIALYEMLRVAKSGVFLSEPNDRPEEVDFLTGRFWEQVKIKAEYEECANYVYPFSRSEAVKVALGSNLPQVLFKGLNDHYIKGVEFEPADRERSEIFRKVTDEIERLDRLCLEGKADYKTIMVGLLKKPLDELSKDNFIAQGWQVLDLPRSFHSGSHKL